jgi:hypothetical protein
LYYLKNSNLDGEKICNFVMQLFAKNFENVNEIYLFEKLLSTLATLGNPTQIKSYLFVSHYQGGQSECRHRHWQVGVVKTFKNFYCDCTTLFHFSTILRTES